MPLDSVSGVFHELHGPSDGQPLMLTMPLMASFAEIFGQELQPVLDGYLSRLTDRYRVLLLDYPSIGNSRDIAPAELTADRVCADLLAVADAAGFDRFAYWGYSWSGNVGLQLACRTNRLSALVIGGWPALGAPYEELLAAAIRKLPNPEPSSLKVLRNPEQYAQWVHYGRSLDGWPEREAISQIRCPRLNIFGLDGDLVEAGIPVPIATRIRTHQQELQEMGWQVLGIEGHGHGLCMQAEVAVPPVRRFLDEVLA
ncbi:MAG: alpha/beta fold hydrolase [Limnohabitans sp.]